MASASALIVNNSQIIAILFLGKGLTSCSQNNVAVWEYSRSHRRSNRGHMTISAENAAAQWRLVNFILGGTES